MWEHLALTRARPVVGNAELAGVVEAFRREVLEAKGQGPAVMSDLAEMRARIADAKPRGTQNTPPVICPRWLSYIRLTQAMAGRWRHGATACAMPSR